MYIKTDNFKVKILDVCVDGENKTYKNVLCYLCVVKEPSNQEITDLHFWEEPWPLQPQMQDMWITSTRARLNSSKA